MTIVQNYYKLECRVFAACGYVSYDDVFFSDSEIKYEYDDFALSCEEYSPAFEPIFFEEIHQIHLSLGDAFRFGDFEIKLGDEIEFVSYAVGLYLYIPIMVTDLYSEPESYFSEGRIWQLFRAVYYQPSGTRQHLVWHGSGGEGSSSPFFWQYPSASAETFVRLSYDGDGMYVLKFYLEQFFLDEDGLYRSRIEKTFSIWVDVAWPAKYTTITIEHIPRDTGEHFYIGNFRAIVSAEFNAEMHEFYTMATHFFPTTLTNIGTTDAYLSSLEFARLGSNCGFPVHIRHLYFEGELVPIQKMPPIPAGESVSFCIPVISNVCEILAWYRSFRITERVVDASHTTVRHHFFDIYVRGRRGYEISDEEINDEIFTIEESHFVQTTTDVPNSSITLLAYQIPWYAVGSKPYDVVADSYIGSFNIAMWTDTPLRNFEFISVSIGNTYDEMIYLSPSETRFTLDELSPDKPIILRPTIGGGIPNRGITFIDENGIQHYFLLTQNGIDSSVILMHYPLAERVPF